MPILQTCHLRPSGLAAASKFPRVVRTGAVAEGWAAATHAACWVVWLVMGGGVSSARDRRKALQVLFQVLFQKRQS